MKRLLLIAVIVASVALGACAELNSGDQVPEPYKAKISALRADQITQAHKCADLQKQIAEINAQGEWDERQMNATASEALNAMGRDQRDWSVNINTLRLESKKR